MASINYTADDGSVVVFVDPAGVQAAVDAAVAALPPAGPVVTPTDTGVTVTHTDGTVESFVPAPEVELPA
jgi:hypothetical protein